MGTNYYRKNIPTEEDLEKMHRLIDEGKLESRRGYSGEEESESVADVIEDCTKEVHICKMSYGWLTCFDHNGGKYYQPNREDLERFLKEPNTVIVDEYGETVSFEDFGKEVDTRDKSIVHGHKPWDSQAYQEYRISEGQRPEYVCTGDIRKCVEIFGIQEPKYNDFTVDGLRFAVFTDFS